MSNETNSWYKLKDGTWGAKLRHAATEGEQVVLTTKDGKQSDVWLVRKIAQFPDASLWSVTSEEPVAVADEAPF
jgi:uncharacterized protein YaeQ